MRHEVINHYHTPFKTRKWDCLLFVVRSKSFSLTCLGSQFSKTEDTSSEQLNIFTENFLIPQIYNTSDKSWRFHINSLSSSSSFNTSSSKNSKIVSVGKKINEIHHLKIFIFNTSNSWEKSVLGSFHSLRH